MQFKSFFKKSWLLCERNRSSIKAIRHKPIKRVYSAHWRNLKGSFTLCTSSFRPWYESLLAVNEDVLFTYKSFSFISPQGFEGKKVEISEGCFQESRAIVHANLLISQQLNSTSASSSLREAFYHHYLQIVLVLNVNLFTESVVQRVPKPFIMGIVQTNSCDETYSSLCLRQPD